MKAISIDGMEIKVTCCWGPLSKAKKQQKWAKHLHLNCGGVGHITCCICHLSFLRGKMFDWLWVWAMWHLAWEITMSDVSMGDVSLWMSHDNKVDKRCNNHYDVACRNVENDHWFSTIGTKIESFPVFSKKQRNICI